jgi:hypothetical protein
MSRAQIFVERVPARDFAEMFLSGGALAGLVDKVRRSHGLLDLDFWVDRRAHLQRASVYCGLAKVVDVYAGRGGHLRLETTSLARRRLGVANERARWVPVDGHDELAAQAMALVDRAVPILPESHIRAGRTLHATSGRTVLARSFGPRFDEDKAGASWLEGITGRVRDALLEVEAIPRNLPPKPMCDALMISAEGSLLLVEAEAPRSPEIGFAPARAAQQIWLWDAWLDADGAALGHLWQVARLREVLGLCPLGTADLLRRSGAARSTYVLATEPSASAALLGRMDRATALLDEAGLLDSTRFRCELTPASEDAELVSAVATPS